MVGGVPAKTDLVDTIICLSLDHHHTQVGLSDNSVPVYTPVYTSVYSGVFFLVFTPYTETFDWLNNYSLIGSHI